jgi:hypothetical protein
MKMIFAFMAALAVVYFITAFRQPVTIDGSSQSRALMSAKKLKRYMTSGQLHEFETAFWTLGEIKSKEDPESFLATVDGKTPEEVVQIAEQVVNAKIAAGDPIYKQYGSWQNMIKLQSAPHNKNSTSESDLPPLRNSVRTGRDSVVTLPAQ